MIDSYEIHLPRSCALSLRGYFRAARNYRRLKAADAKAFPRSGVNGETIGLLGLGKIATRLCQLLAPYPIRVIAYDPMVSPERALELGVELVSLDQVFARAQVVSNHIPDIDTTRGTIGVAQFQQMRDGATFINTGRGAQVVELDLLNVFRDHQDLTALLDVTWPEPPVLGSPFWELGNVIISPHIGGTIGDEVSRLADCVIEEFERWTAGLPLRYQVTREVFATMG